MLKKLSLSFFLALFLLTTLVSSAKAQESTWYNQDYREWFAKVYDTSNPTEIFGERYTAAQVQWILYSIIAMPMTNGSGLFTCLTTKAVNECADVANELLDMSLVDELNKSAEKKSFNGQGVNFAQFLFSDRPLSGITYVKQNLRKFHIIPEAQAQGFGFSSFNLIQDAWRAFRDIAYSLLILVVIVYAFMIMFRVKIAPQTVITIQSALPKLIGAIILITFSYAIAGFIVDLMYVVMGLLTTLRPIPTFGALSLLFFTPSILIIFLIGLGIFMFVLIVGIILGALFGLGTLGAGWILLLIFVILMVIFLILFLWYFAKLLIMLIKTVASILLLVIFAPIQILAGTFAPGVGGFGKWLKSLISNLIVFPVVGIMFTLHWYFLFLSLKSLTALSPLSDAAAFLNVINNFIAPVLEALRISWTPPTPTGFFVPMMGYGFEPLILLGVSFMIFINIPKVSDIIKSMIEGKPFAYGTAIGEALAPARTVGLYGAAEGLNFAEKQFRMSRGPTAPTPGWIQASRRILGVKST